MSAKANQLEEKQEENETKKKAKWRSGAERVFSSIPSQKAFFCRVRSAALLVFLPFDRLSSVFLESSWMGMFL